MRGEYFLFVVADPAVTGSPPLARGILANGIYKIGKTGDHPRLRGEYRMILGELSSAKGSPPLARGILHRFYIVIFDRGITPACAGNTTIASNRATHSQDHPRLRGEYSVFCFRFYRRIGSPPLARGILIPVIPVKSLTGITPACAGNTETN